MPDWTHSLRTTIDDAIRAARPREPFDEIKSLLARLAAAVMDGQTAAADAILDTLDDSLEPDEIAIQLLGRAFLENDNSRAAAGIGFVVARSLLPDERIVAFLHDSVADAVARTRVLTIMATRVWTLEALCTAIHRSGYGTALSASLVAITLPEGADALQRRLLECAASYVELFTSIVRAFLAAGIPAGKLVRVALELADGPRVPTVSLLISALVGLNTWSLDGVLRYIFEEAAALVGLLVDILLRSGVSTLDRVHDLLSVPVRLYADYRVRMRELFERIAGALIAFARASDQLSLLMTRLLSWASAHPQPVVFATEGTPWEFARGLGVMEAPLQVWLIGTFFRSMAGSGLIAPAAAFDVARAFVTAVMAVEVARDALLEAFLRIPGVFVFLLPALVLVAAATPMSFVEWLGQDIRSIRQHDRPLDIRELPEPAEGGNGVAPVRYMIFSDLHRDAREDVVDPVLFDVAHFSKPAHTATYLRALDYCEKNDYTVIENGDCEELWYRPRLFGDPAARASDILGRHNAVYSVLQRLNAQGRHFRTRGNHDNWWMMGPGRTGPLEARFGSGFPVLDGLVIPGVKTMKESKLAGRIPTPGALPSDPLQALLDVLPFGLSPDRYHEKSPLLVLHGHQVDFWNCDEHSFLGLAITNAIGVPFDALPSLLYYLKGLDDYGNPVMEFENFYASRPPMDNWPPAETSRRWARQIEFLDEKSRRLADSYSFSETLAASLTLALRYAPAGISLANPLGLGEVQVLMGHTHNPQSRPYLNLDSGPLGLLPGIAKDAISWVKVNYFNSGTSGWWENLIWAIEITAKGQPRLVYWDEHSFEPQLMSWELHEPLLLDADQFRSRLSGLRQAAGLSSDATLPLLKPSQTSLSAEDLPILQGLHSFNLASLTHEAQHAALAWGFISLTRSIAAHVKRRQASESFTLEYSIDLDNVRVGERSVGEVASAAAPLGEPLSRVFAAWLRAFQVISNPAARTTSFTAPWRQVETADLISLCAALMYCAYISRSSVLHTTGMLCHLASSARLRAAFRYDDRTHQIRIRIENDARPVRGTPAS